MHPQAAGPEPKPLVAVVGPTAVGKSRIGLLVAKSMGTELLTADSRQVYRRMDIGTDKPTLAERQGVPHRLIDLVEPDEPFNVGTYRRLALAEIDRLHREGQVPVLVGGTGLYVRAVLRGLWDGPSADWTFRAKLMQEAGEKGGEYLHRELLRVDPDLAARLHPHDHVKIVRGLEVHHLLGRPLSEVHRRHAFQDPSFAPLVLGLTREREVLYQLVEQRVEVELSKGLIRETEALLGQGYGRDVPSMKSLGYRQIAGYLAGDYGYEEAVRQLKRDTRHFAKRQMTWFRREPSIRWVAISEGEAAEATAQRLLELIGDYLARLKTAAGGDGRRHGSSHTVAV